MVEAEGSGGAGRPVESGCGDWPSPEAGKAVQTWFTPAMPSGPGVADSRLAPGVVYPKGKAAGADGGLSGQGAELAGRSARVSAEQTPEGGLGGHWRSCQIGSSVGGGWRQ